MPLRLTLDTLRLQRTRINPVGMLIPFKMGILEFRPALTLGDKVLPALRRSFPETHLFSPAALRRFAVSASEILLRVTVNPVIHPLREHDMCVRLLAAGYRRFRVMDSKLVSMTVANFLQDKITDQLKTLLRFQLTRQGYPCFAVGAAVGMLERVSGFPELRRLLR